MLDILLISSLFFKYFECYNTITIYIMMIGFNFWKILIYLTLLTFLVRDDNLKKIYLKKEEGWFKKYDEVTDFLMFVGLWLNGLTFCFMVWLVFKIKLMLIRKGYAFLDMIQAKAKQLNKDEEMK